MLCMAECKLDVVKCLRCKVRWEYVRGEQQRKLCEGCREKIKESYRNRTAEANERDLERRRLKYETDEAFRNRASSYVLKRTNKSVECPECKKEMLYYSLRVHQRKACKGPNSKTVLQKITELS